MTPLARDVQLDAVARVLRAHKRPLHWEMIAKIARGENPGMFRDGRDVGTLIALHRERFRPRGDGVYELEAEGVFSERRIGPLEVLPWPDGRTALFLGAMCARGEIDPDDNELTISFRYGGRPYSHRGRVGYIGKGTVAFKAADVISVVPRAVAAEIKPIVGRSTLSVVEAGNMSFRIDVDAHRERALVDDCLRLLDPGFNFVSFNVPARIMVAPGPVKRSFLRGFGQVCGLASSGTNLYGDREQVWLRPDTDNKPLFYQLMTLCESLGIHVYWNDRNERDIAIKIHCEDWLGIGFGIEWLDQIVEEGARLNGRGPSQSGRKSRQDSRLQTPSQPRVTPVLTKEQMERAELRAREFRRKHR